MENNLRTIPIQEPFRKRWSEATTIISEDDLKAAESIERTDSIDGESQRTRNDLNGNIQIIKGLSAKMPDIRIHSENRIFEQRDVEKIGHAHKRAHSNVTFKTPQKLPIEYPHNMNCLHSELHKTLSDSFLSEQSDWMLAERSHSRSPPSPAVGSRSPDIISRSPAVQRSPAVHNSTNIFNFSPERTEHYREQIESESRRVKKRLFDEMSSGSQEVLHSPVYSVPVSLASPSHHHGDSFLSPRKPHSPRQQLSRDHPSRDLILPHDLTIPHDVQSRDQQEQDVPFYLSSPMNRRKLSSIFHNKDQFRAKRRLDVDQGYVSSPKRVKSDLEREMGFRYIQQLESDISNIQNKLHGPETEVKPPSSCTCAIMENHFLEMAESAYRAVRRIDASPRGFEQFRKELIETNQVMKDSMEVLKNIRSFCGEN